MSPTAEPTLSGGLDTRMRTTLKTVALAAGVLALGAFAAFDPRTGLSVALGGAVAVANLWALARIIAALLPAGPGAAETAQKQSRAGWAVVAGMKMLGLLAVFWLLMRHGVVGGLPMLVGFGSLPIGIVIGSLVSDRSAPAE